MQRGLFMKVYRCVPNNIITALDKGIIWPAAQTSEDILYDLGYMNFTNANPYFLISSNLNTFECFNEKSKSFFLFPWDAIRNMMFIERRYSRLGASILEYEIPDEILMEYLGIGFYDGVEIPEFKIPISILKSDELIFKEMPEEIKNLFIETYKNRGKEIINFILPFIENRLKSNEDKKEVINYIEKFFNESCLNMLFKYLGMFFKSNLITGRRFFVSNRDIFNLTNFAKAEIIIARSNGILTKENFTKWLEYTNIARNYDTRAKINFYKTFLLNEKNNTHPRAKK